MKEGKNEGGEERLRREGERKEKEEREKGGRKGK